MNAVKQVHIIAPRGNETNWTLLCAILGYLVGHHAPHFPNRLELQKMGFRSYDGDKVQRTDPTLFRKITPDDLTRFKEKIAGEYAQNNVATTLRFIIQSEIGSFDEGVKLIQQFLFIRSRFTDCRLCIDTSAMSDTHERDRTYYSLNQFLWNYHGRDIFYNQYVSSAGEIKAHDIRRVRGEKAPEILSRFTPLMEIDRITYEDLFQTSIDDTLRLRITPQHPEPKTEWHFFTLTKNDFPIAQPEDTPLVNFLWRKCIDGFQKIKQETFRQAMFSDFQHEPILSLYLAILYLENQTEFKTSYLHLTADYTAVKPYLRTLKEYFIGLREIAENLIFHTDAKHGFFFLKLIPRNAFSTHQELMPGFTTYRDALFHKHIPFHMVFQIELFDFSSRGITETFVRRPRQADQPVAQATRLLDFFVGDFERFENLSRLDFRHLAQLGLKTFSRIVIENDGLLQVASASTKAQNNGFVAAKIFNSPVEFDLPDKKGTSYSLFIPVRLTELQESQPHREARSFSATFQKWISKNNLPDVHFVQEIPKYSPAHMRNINDKYTFIETSAQAILQKITAQVNHALAFNFQMLEQQINDLPVVIKILSYIQLNRKFKFLIIYDADETFIDFVRKLIGVYESSGVVWNDDVYIYLFDTQGIPFIITGRKIERLLEINHKVKAHYGQNYPLRSPQEDTPTENEKYHDNIYPFDILKPDPHQPTAFENAVAKLFESELDKSGAGVRITKTHVRVGSFIHLENFYEANFIFHNSFYVDRFAFLICRNILDTLAPSEKAETLLLLGYGEYSEMLLARLKYMFDAFNLKHTVLDYFICRDVVRFDWYNTVKFNKLDAVPVRQSKICLIVPVNSTLNTNRLIFNEFTKVLKEKFGVEHSQQDLIYNASILLVRDRATETCSDAEKSVGWKSINRKKRTVDTALFNKPVQYFIEKEGIWSIPLTCPKCFPDLYAGGSMLAEECINETNDVSTIPKTIFYREQNVQLSHKAFHDELSRVKLLSGSIKYGHIQGYGVHHDYYIDSRAFCSSENNINALKNWFRIIRHEYQKHESCHHIIISIKNSTNAQFINLAKDEIFDGVVSHINLDLSKTTDNSYLLRSYGYLNGQQVKFHFFTDVLSAGSSLEAAIGYLLPLQQKMPSPIMLFSSVVVLVNRLDQDKLHDIQQKYLGGNKKHTHIRSFINLQSPQIHATDTDCSKCEERKKNESIYDHAALQLVRRYFKARIHSLAVKNHMDIEQNEAPRHFKRLLLAQELTYEFRQPNPDIPGIIARLEQKHSASLYDHINLIKVIAVPPYAIRSQYRKHILQLLLRTSNKIVSAPPDNSFLQFNALIAALKRIAYFRSNYLIRKENIDKIWRFFAVFKSHFACLGILYPLDPDAIGQIIRLGNYNINIKQLAADYPPGSPIASHHIEQLSLKRESDRRAIQEYFKKIPNEQLYAIIESIFANFYTSRAFTEHFDQFIKNAVTTDRNNIDLLRLIKTCTTQNEVITEKIREIKNSPAMLLLHQDFMPDRLELIHVLLQLKAIYYLKDLARTDLKNFADADTTISEHRNALARRRDDILKKQKENFETQPPTREILLRITDYIADTIEPFTKEFHALDHDLSLKSYLNFRTFGTIMVSILKRVVSDDESASFRYSYLTGSGEEYTGTDVADIPYQHKIYNQYFSYPTDLVMKQIKDEYFSFKVSINLENLFVLQKFLKNLERETAITEALHRRIKKNFPEFNDTTPLLGLIADDIARDPKYRFINILTPPDDLRKLFTAFTLKKYIEYYNSNTAAAHNIERFLNTIVRFLCAVMDADHAFLAIRKFKHTSDKNLYVISRYSADPQSDSTKHVPFELDGITSSFTYNYVNDEKSLKTFENDDMGRVGPEKYVEKLTKENFDLLGLNLFVAHPPEDGEFSKIGGITFVHKMNEADSKNHKFLRAKRKEALKFILLIINDLQKFLENKFDNENFINWIEMAKSNRVYEMRNNKFKHNARTHSLKMLSKTSASIELNCYARLINADLFIGDQFSRYVSKTNLIRSSRTTVSVADCVFQKRYIDTLLFLPKLRGFQTRIIIERKPEYFDSLVNIYPGDFMDILFLLVDNALRHGDRQGWIKVYYEYPYLVIENSMSPASMPDEKFAHIKQRASEEKCLSDGITLFTLEKYCKENYKQTMELELIRANSQKSITTDIFVIKIPLN